MESTLELVCDAGPSMQLLEEAVALIERSPDWLRWLAAQVFERLEQPIELSSVDPENVSAGGTGELRILAKPTDEFVLLVAALRAGNGEPSIGVVFPLDGHGSPRE